MESKTNSNLETSNSYFDEDTAADRVEEAVLSKKRLLPTDKGKEKEKKKKGSNAKPTVKMEAACTARIRTSNFSEVEDICLAKAYINVSQNSVSGANQKLATFWASIKEKFDVLLTSENPPDDDDDSPFSWTTRKPDSLMHRWNRSISRDVRKFTGYYQRAKAVERSGWNDADYMTQAEDDWLHHEKSKFKYSHVLDTMWKSAQFRPRIATDNKTHNEISSAQGTELERPIGSKKAKALRMAEKEASAKASVASIDSAAAANQYAITVCTSTDRVTAELANGRKIVEYRTKMDFVLESAKLYQKLNMLDESRAAMAELQALASGFDDYCESLNRSISGTPISEITMNLAAKDNEISAMESGHRAGDERVLEEEDDDGVGVYNYN